MSEERKLILQMLEQGRITVEEAERLLTAVHELPIGGYSEVIDGAYEGADEAEAGWSAWSGTGLEAICPPGRAGDLEAATETTVELPPGARLRLKDAHGGAVVTGGDVSAAQVRVLRRVRAEDPGLAQRLLREYRVHVALEGEELVVRSSRPQVQWRGDRSGGQGMWIYYQIVVPRQTAASISFEHGKVQVAELVAPVELAGAHGEWEGRDLSGPVRLRHEHGPVRLSRLGAGLEAQKSHGPLEITGLAGDLRLKAQHSPVRVTGLEGAAELQGGHGDWELRDLSGPVQLKHEHGAVQLTNLGAGLEVHKSHGSLEVAGVRGDLQLHSEHGDRALSQISGQARIRHNHGCVSLRGLGGGLDVKAQHARLDVELTAPLAGDVSLQMSHTHAALRLPAGSSARVDIATQHGHIEAPGLPVVEKARHFERVRGQIGDGEHQITAEGAHTSVSLIVDEDSRL